MPPASFAPGEVLDGRYQLVRPLGSGGMGEVHVARRIALGDLVAIKRLHAAQDTPENRARFLGEARAAAHIQHPNVVRVFDFGDAADQSPYMVMEYLDGPTLGAELALRGRIPAGDAVELFAPVCAAVEAGHRRGIVHRDLKPANVILARADDGSRVVKVLDFGLAVMASGSAARLTSPGTIVGTCSYMAPEQVAGLPAMPASDVFALGVILYEMVTGVLPFEAETQMATLFKISQGHYRAPRELTPELPRPLEEAITAALQVDPARRPSRPEQLIALAGAARAGTGPIVLSELRGPTGSEPTAVVEAPPTGARPARVAIAAPRLDVFVGRAAELQRLDDEHRDALAGRGRIAVLAGDDGAGRTRLVETFGRRAASGGALVVTARFFDPSSQPPLHDAFARALVHPERGPSSGRVEGTDEVRRGFAGADAGAAVVAALRNRAGSRPLVVVLEDVHLARGPELEVIDQLQRELGAAGALVIATVAAATVRRDAAGEVARWIGGHVQRRTAVAIRLRAFTVTEIRAFLDAAFGVVHVRPRDLRRLDAAAGGNPFYLAETVRHLISAGAIRRRDDEWIVEVPDELDVPPTVSALVDARAGALDPELLGVLELAATAGDEPRFEELAAASGTGEDALEKLLERGVIEGLLTREGAGAGEGYRFTSALVRAALYARMSPRARKRAHRRLLDAVIAAPPAPADRAAAARAMHRAALDEMPAAFADALAALAGAIERGDGDSGEASLARARQACARLDATGAGPAEGDRARLDYLGGVVSVRIGRMGEARALLARAGEAARRAGDGALELDVLLEMVHCQVGLGDLDGAIAGAAQAITAARSRNDRLRAARGAVALSLALLRRGRFDDAGAIAAEVVADAGLPAAVRAWAHRNRAWVAFSQGRFAAGVPDADRALALARGAGDPVVLWHALNARAALASESGDRELARGEQEESLELARRGSLRRCEAISLANLGEDSWEQGDAEHALDSFREALSIFLDIEDRACEGDCRVNVGRALLATGERAAAVAMLERGRELCDATGRAEYAALAQLHLGEARLGEGAAAAARAAIGDARQRLDALGSHHLWRAELLLAQAALAAEDRERARYHARRAQEHVDVQRGQLAPGSASAFDRVTRGLRELLDQLG